MLKRKDPLPLPMVLLSRSDTDGENRALNEMAQQGRTLFRARRTATITAPLVPRTTPPNVRAAIVTLREQLQEGLMLGQKAYDAKQLQNATIMRENSDDSEGEIVERFEKQIRLSPN
jgi:hypothetical protein